jgi:hypothetical protein
MRCSVSQSVQRPQDAEAVPEQARERETTDRKREVATRGPGGGRKGRPNCSAAHEVGAKGSQQWV